MNFGANNDMKRFMTHSTPYELLPSAGYPDEMEKFQVCLNTLGMPGLARPFGSEQCAFYCTGYCCKGAKSSREWSKAIDYITTSERGVQAHGLRFRS